MNAGEAFYVEDSGVSYDSHLWFILSDPNIDPDKVLLVNFTALRDDKDHSCVVKVGEHPYVRKDTCVNYSGAKVVKISELQQLLASGKIVNHTPATDMLLKRMRDGTMESRDMNLSHARILFDQGLVDA